MSKAPPVDTSLRPGPVSRWQRPVLPHEEPSPIRSAVLSPPAKPAHPSWDQLPPAEKLRHRAAIQAAPTDPAFYDRLTGPDPIIRFTPAPLTQPASIAPADELNVGPAPSPANLQAPPNALSIGEKPVPAMILEPAPKEPSRIYSAFAINPVAVTADEEVVSPTIVSDCMDTPEDWLRQAQQAATRAESTEELSAVIDLCDRGIHGKPSAELLSSLRKLSAWAYNRRGELMADGQRPDDAIHDFQVAISMDPVCSLAIHNRAVTLAQRNQFGAALRDFNRVIELNPGLAVAYRNRAELLAALGRMEEAVADYSQALETLPNDATLLCARAYAYQRLGDFPHAATDLTRALKLAPHDPGAFTQRGNLAAEQGKFEQAQEDFHRAIAIDANWADAHRSLAWLQATCADQRVRNAKQALAEAEQAALLSSPDDYLILDTLAAAHACAGQFKQAVQLEEKAISAAPRDNSTPLEQRLALYKQGRMYSSAPPAPSAVRRASHESPAPLPSSRPAPSSGQ